MKDNATKQQITAALILLLLTSFFISRAALSVSTVVFVVVQISFYYKEFSFTTLPKKWHYLIISTLFFIAILTYYNSSNIAEWKARTLVKLPLLFLPIAFLYIRLNNVSITLIHTLFVVLVVGGTIYSIGNYYLYTDALEYNYNYAKVLPTILDNDHIRFSWCVVIAMLLLFYENNYTKNKKIHYANIGIGVWLFIYLHILGSKTGLLLCYTTISIYILYVAFVQKQKKYLLLLLLIAFIPIVAYYSLPTFKKRVDYIRYDFSLYSKGDFKSGLSDAVRVASIKAGISIANNNPIIGVGYGDIQQEVNKWYTTNTSFAMYEKILPSSQFVIVLAVSGWLGLSIFLGSIFLQLLYKPLRSNISFILFYTTAVLSFIFEIALEGQFGVFIFTFFTCWFMYLAKPTTNE